MPLMSNIKNKSITFKEFVSSHGKQQGVQMHLSCKPEEFLERNNSAAA